MLTDNLFRDVLSAPVISGGANTLYVVSGYANAGMVGRHFNEIREKLRYKNTPPFCVNLIVGMTAKRGETISPNDHAGFVYLAEEPMKEVFSCAYLMEPPPIHSKVYAWFRDDKPVNGYIGSANYTQQAFFRDQREAMTLGDPCEIRDYYKKAAEQSCFCTHDDVQGLVGTTEFPHGKDSAVTLQHGNEAPVAPQDQIKLSLLMSQGGIHTRAGLNWGQRPKREPNQAYIPVPAQMQRSSFFPPRGQHFTVHTDDGQTFICARCQDDGKAIETTANNSILGTYFRLRIGVELGRMVTEEDLKKYGRTDVTFVKLDDDNYYMDFDPTRQG